MAYYDEVELEDLDFEEDEQMFYYPCPCGDRFEISLEELLDGDDIARCPSCTLILKVKYSEEDLDQFFLEE